LAARVVAQEQEKEEEVNREGGRGSERERERVEAMVGGFMTKEERGGMRSYLHPQKMMRIILYIC